MGARGDLKIEKERKEETKVSTNVSIEDRQMKIYVRRNGEISRQMDGRFIDAFWSKIQRRVTQKKKKKKKKRGENFGSKRRRKFRNDESFV